MASLLDQPLGNVLGVSSQADSISPSVEAFVTRIAGVALELAQGAAPAALAKALASVSNAALVGAFGELLTLDAPSSHVKIRALLRGRVALVELLEASGGVWSAEEATTNLGRSRASLQKWRDGKRVIALRQADGSYKYPVAQFAPSTTDLGKPVPLPGIQGVLAAAGTALTPEELVALLATSHASLQGSDRQARTGFEALAAGDADIVIDLVRHVATPADAEAPDAYEEDRPTVSA